MRSGAIEMRSFENGAFPSRRNKRKNKARWYDSIEYHEKLKAAHEPKILTREEFVRKFMKTQIQRAERTPIPERIIYKEVVDVCKHG